MIIVRNHICTSGSEALLVRDYIRTSDSQRVKFYRTVARFKAKKKKKFFWSSLSFLFGKNKNKFKNYFFETLQDSRKSSSYFKEYQSVCMSFIDHWEAKRPPLIDHQFHQWKEIFVKEDIYWLTKRTFKARAHTYTLPELQISRDAALRTCSPRSTIAEIWISRTKGFCL